MIISVNIINSMNSVESIDNLPLLFRLELLRNYKNRENIKPDDVLVQYIHQNYDNMDYTSLKNTVTKCMTESDMKSIILSYELKFYRDLPQETTFDEFSEKANKLLTRYHYKAGGFQLEDPDWSTYRYPCEKYGLKKNEIIFVNTMHEIDVDTKDSDDYLDNLISRLQSLTSNIKLESRYKYHSHGKLVHVIILGIKDLDINDVDTEEFISDGEMGL